MALGRSRRREGSLPPREGFGPGCLPARRHMRHMGGSRRRRSRGRCGGPRKSRLAGLGRGEMRMGAKDRPPHGPGPQPVAELPGVPRRRAAPGGRLLNAPFGGNDHAGARTSAPPPSARSRPTLRRRLGAATFAAWQTAPPWTRSPRPADPGRPSSTTRKPKPPCAPSTCPRLGPARQAPVIPPLSRRQAPQSIAPSFRPLHPSFPPTTSVIPAPYIRHSHPLRPSFPPPTSVIPTPYIRHSRPLHPSLPPTTSVIPAPYIRHSHPLHPSFPSATSVIPAKAGICFNGLRLPVSAGMTNRRERRGRRMPFPPRQRTARAARCRRRR